MPSEVAATTPRTNSWDDHVCCQCKAKGSVWSKFLPVESRWMNCPEPIIWMCVICNGYVCINCIYTIPDSHPVEIATPCCCSAKCRQEWRDQGGVEDD